MTNEQTLPPGGEDPIQLLTAARNALTDAMVERLTGTAANTLEVLDRFNEPETREAVGRALDALVELHRSGALDTAVQLLQFLHASRAALTPTNSAPRRTDRVMSPRGVRQNPRAAAA